MYSPCPPKKLMDISSQTSLRIMYPNFSNYQDKWPGMVAYICNSKTWEGEARDHHEFEASLKPNQDSKLVLSQAGELAQETKALVIKPNYSS